MSDKEAAAWFQLAPSDEFIFSNTLKKDAVIRTSEDTQRILLGTLQDTESLLTLDGENLYINNNIHVDTVNVSKIKPYENEVIFEGTKIKFSSAVTEFSKPVNFTSGVNIKELFVNGNILLDSQGKLQVKNVIKDGSLTNNKLSDGVITNDKIAIESIETDSYSNESITGEKLDSYTLPARVFVDKTITSRVIDDKSIEERHLTDKCVDTHVLKDGSVDTDIIANDSIITQKLSSNLLLRGNINVSSQLTSPEVSVTNKINMGDVSLSNSDNQLVVNKGVDIKGPLKFDGELNMKGNIWKPTQWSNLSESKISYTNGDVLIDKNLNVKGNLNIGNSVGFEPISDGISLKDGVFNISSGKLSLNDNIVLNSDKRTLGNINEIDVDGDVYIDKTLYGVSNANLNAETFMFNNYHMDVSSLGVQQGSGSINTRYYQLAVLRSIAEVNNFGCLTITGDVSGGSTYQSAGSVHIVIANRNGSENQSVTDFVTTTVWGGEPSEIASGVDLQLYEDEETGRYYIYLKSNLNSTYNLTLRGGNIIANNTLVYDWPDTVINDTQPNKVSGQRSFKLRSSLIDFPTGTHYPYKGFGNDKTESIKFKSPVDFYSPIYLSSPSLQINKDLELYNDSKSSFISTNAKYDGGWITTSENQKSLQLCMNSDDGSFDFKGTNIGENSSEGTGLSFDNWLSISNKGLVAPLSCGVTKFEDKFLKVQSNPNNITIYGYSVQFENLSHNEAEWIKLFYCNSCTKAHFDVQGNVVYKDIGSSDFHGQIYIDKSDESKTKTSLSLMNAIDKTDTLLNTFDITAGFNDEDVLEVFLKCASHETMTIGFRYISLTTDSSDIETTDMSKEVKHFDTNKGISISQPDVFDVRDSLTGNIGYNTFTPTNTIDVSDGTIGAKEFFIDNDFILTKDSSNLMINETIAFDANGQLVTEFVIPDYSIEYSKLTSNAQYRIWKQLQSNIANAEVLDVQHINVMDTGLLKNRDDSALYLENVDNKEFGLTVDGIVNMIGEDVAIYKNGQPWVTSPWNSNISPDYIYYESNIHVGGTIYTSNGLQSLNESLDIESEESLYLKSGLFIQLDTPSVRNKNSVNFMDPDELKLYNIEDIETKTLNVCNDLSLDGNLNLTSSSSRILFEGSESNMYLNLWYRESDKDGKVTAKYDDGNVEISNDLVLKSSTLHLSDYVYMHDEEKSLYIKALRGVNARRYSFHNGGTFYANDHKIGLNESNPSCTFQVNGNFGVKEGEVISKDRKLLNITSIDAHEAQFIVQNDGKVGIKNIDPLHELTVNGTIGINGEEGILYTSNKSLVLKGTNNVIVRDTLSIDKDLNVASNIECATILCKDYIELENIQSKDDEICITAPLVEFPGFRISSNDKIADDEETFYLSKDKCKFTNVDIDGRLNAQYIHPIIIGPPSYRELDLTLTEAINGSIERSTDKESPGFSVLSNILNDSNDSAVCLVDRQDHQKVYLAATNNEGSKTFMNIAYQPISDDIPKLPAYENIELDAYVIDNYRDTHNFMGDVKVIGPNGIEAIGPNFKSYVRSTSWNSNNYEKTYVEIGTQDSESRIKSSVPLNISANGTDKHLLELEDNVYIPGTVKLGLNVLSKGGLKQVYADEDGNLTTSVSDRRCKKDIYPAFDEDSSVCESVIERLNPVRFKWLLDNKNNDNDNEDEDDIGLIAQEAGLVYPECVGIDTTERLYLKYDRLIPLLLQGLKEANKKIKNLEDRLFT